MKEIKVMTPDATVTTLYSPELIEQTTLHNDVTVLAHQTAVRTLRLQERGVREALIKLGWTPPNGDENET